MTRSAVFRSADTDSHRGAGPHGADSHGADSHGADLRLVPVMLAGYVAAFCGGGLSPLAALPIWAVCALAGVRLLRRTRRRTLAAALLVSAGIGLAATARVVALHTGPIPRLAAAHAPATVEIVVTDDPRTVAPTHPGRGPLTVIPARAETVTGTAATGSATGSGTTYRVRSPITVLAASSAKGSEVGARWHDLLPSTRVVVTGRLGPPGDGWPDAAVLSTHLVPRVVAGPSLLQRVAGHLRQGLRDACERLPADERGLIPGLVIGDVSEEPASLATAFRATGLTHLTAVSGENLVFILTAAMPAARCAGARGRGLTAFGMAVVVGFTVLARPEPSMVRASAMSLVGLAVLASGRRSRGVPLLCAGSLLLLLLDPWLARSYGFALSLSATAGLFILAPGWQDRLARRRIPHRIAESLACTAAAETFCLPILVSLTAAITPLSLPANLLAEFCVGPATVLGAVALLAAAVWLPLGEACAWLAQWPTDALVGIARYGSTLPGATVRWPSGASGTCALLAVYAVVFVGLVSVTARRNSR